MTDVKLADDQQAKIQNCLLQIIVHTHSCAVAHRQQALGYLLEQAFSAYLFAF
jgi:hypothetical protein